MARPKKFEVFSYPQYGVEIQVYYDKEHSRFTATVDGELILAASPAELKNLITPLVQANYDLVWQPVIVVKYPNTVFIKDEPIDPDLRNELRGNVSFRAERRWFALRHDNVWRDVHWGTTPERRVAASQVFRRKYKTEEMGNYGMKPLAEPVVMFDIPWRDNGRYADSNHEVYVPYTDEKWAALAALNDLLNQITRKIDVLLTGDDLTTLMTTMAGGNLLAAGEPVNQEDTP